MYLAGVDVDVNKLVDQLEKVAGPLALKGWEIMVRQEIAYGIVHTLYAIVAALLFITVVVGGIRGSRYIWKKADTDRQAHEAEQARRREAAGRGGYFVGEKFEDEGYWISLSILVILCAVVGILTFFSMLGYAEDGILHLYNPEYFAIKDILGR